MKINNSILIIGAPKSGKTTFQAQLYGRMQAHSGCVKLEKSSEDFSGLQKAYDCLARGEEIPTTPAGENLEVIMKVSLAGETFDLVCKDYGGEQVRDISNLLEYNKKWINRVKSNDRWILFIRLNQVYHEYDLSLSGFAELDEQRDDIDPRDRLSSQYHLLELVQILLHARGTSVKSSIQIPKLVIALTCWDELKSTRKPIEEFVERLPLFHNLIKNLWKPESYKVVGLSSQEFALDNDLAKDRYLDELPETFGYLVLDDNPKEPDLTKLIEIALKL